MSALEIEISQFHFQYILKVALCNFESYNITTCLTSPFLIRQKCFK